MAAAGVKVGQIWERTKDGKRVRIHDVKNVGYLSQFLDIKWRAETGKGRGICYQDTFFRNYNLVEEAS